MSPWVLCVMLMHPTRTQAAEPSHRVCWEVPSEQACLDGMNEWLKRARAWEDRTHSSRGPFAGCRPSRS